MEFRTALTARELREVANMTRSWRFWARFLAVNWYATLLAGALIAVVVNALIHRQPMLWKQFLILLAVDAALYAYSWFRYTRKFTKLAARAAARNRTGTLDAEGVHSQSESGATTFVPWRAFDLCFEGKLIFLLKGNEATVAIPCDEMNRDTLGTYLRSNIVTHLTE
jgi:hypothetical protein